MRTTLYEKLFIDGFLKPSYVVATLELERTPEPRALEQAILGTLERHPRLRSLVEMRFGVPFALVPQPARAWFDRGGLRVVPAAELHALEERLLSSQIDLVRAMPVEVYLVGEPAALVVKFHHAVIDATSGFALLDDFARLTAGRDPAKDRPQTRRRNIGSLTRALDWLRRAQLRPRLPSMSVSANYQPTATLCDEPVVYTERVLPGAFPRIAERARKRGATFSELLASALLSAMHRYNTERSTSPPTELGLMFARARPRPGDNNASFTADTCVVSVPAAQLSSLHDPATLLELRRAARDTHHNDLALAALYTTRKIRGKSHAPEEQRSLHFTLSDLTSFGRRLGRLKSGLAVKRVRVLASPTSFDHAGLLVSRFEHDVRFSLIAHRGAVDAGALLSATFLHLEES